MAAPPTPTTPSNTPSFRIVIGCDSAGVNYKTALKTQLQKDPRVTEVIDVGVTTDGGDLDTAYPHIGVACARKVADGSADRGLLICGTGMGVAISANKVAGVWSRRADVYLSV
jgi:ribose 5-phosphate isomerase B